MFSLLFQQRMPYQTKVQDVEITKAFSSSSCPSTSRSQARTPTNIPIPSVIGKAVVRGDISFRLPAFSDTLLALKMKRAEGLNDLRNPAATPTTGTQASGNNAAIRQETFHGRALCSCQKSIAVRFSLLQMIAARRARVFRAFVRFT